MMEIKIVLPQANDAFGRWMESHGASISFCMQLGQYDVTISWGVVHSYSDERGEHRERWEISRRHADLGKAIGLAAEQAMKVQSEGAPACRHKTIVGGNDCRWCADCGADFEPHVEGLVLLATTTTEGR